VNFAKLVREQELKGHPDPARPLILEEEVEEPEEPLSGIAPGSQAPSSAFATSPSPSSSFMGLDDIAMVDSSYIVISADVAERWDRSKLMSGTINNYRIFNKSDGSVAGTLGTATFWAPVWGDRPQRSDRSAHTLRPISNR